MIKREELIEISNNDWAKFYNCKPELFKERGSFVYDSENAVDSDSIGIRHIGNHSFVAVDPEIRKDIEDFISILPKDISLNLEHFVTFFGNKKIFIESVTSAYMLTQDEIIQPSNLDDRFSIRRLELNDKEDLLSLNKTCTPEEVDNAYVEIDHEIILGCFDGDKLVSAASTVDWDAYYDIGIITHSDYRKRGLAKRLVYELCLEIFKSGKIPLYRFEVSLFGSAGVAKSLGFKEMRDTYYREESLRFKRLEK